MHFFDYKTRILKLKGVELGQLRDGGGGWGVGREGLTQELWTMSLLKREAL